MKLGLLLVCLSHWTRYPLLSCPTNLRTSEGVDLTVAPKVSSEECQPLQRWLLIFYYLNWSVLHTPVNSFLICVLWVKLSTRSRPLTSFEVHYPRIQSTSSHRLLSPQTFKLVSSLVCFGAYGTLLHLRLIKTPGTHLWLPTTTLFYSV